MNTPSDLPKLALALEYADLAAALYLAGGSDHAAQLLAAAAEEVMGELAKLLGSHAQKDEVQTLLARIALRYKAPLIDTRLQAASRQSQFGSLAPDDNEVRSATATYLRAVWYMLESMGLEAVIPQRVQKAVDQSTIYL